MGRSQAVGRQGKQLGSVDAKIRLLAGMPTKVLELLAEAVIGELDSRMGDPDLEPEEDRCLAGDDAVFSGPVITLCQPMISRPGRCAQFDRAEL